MWTTRTETEPQTEIEIINRRGYDPQAEEAERLARRREIKERLAKLQLAHQRQAELLKARKQIDLDLDRLAAEHEEKLEGVQGALAIVERRLIACISQGKPTDSEDEAQRRQLLQEIDAANLELQRKLRETKERIPVVEKELATIRPIAGQYQASKRDLWERSIADPKLYRQYLVAKNRAEFADVRVKSLSERLGDFQEQLDKNKRWQASQPGNSYARDIERWQLLSDDAAACLDDAHDQLTQARNEAERIRQQIIAE